MMLYHDVANAPFLRGRQTVPPHHRRRHRLVHQGLVRRPSVTPCGLIDGHLCRQPKTK
jgi:hypothetical protein